MLTFWQFENQLFQAVQIGILSLCLNLQKRSLFLRKDVASHSKKKQLQVTNTVQTCPSKRGSSVGNSPRGENRLVTNNLRAISMKLDTVRGPSFYSPCPCAEAIQQTSCHYSAWWTSKHWALRGQEKPQFLSHCHIPLILNHFMPVLFFLFASSVFTLALSPPPSSHWGLRNALLLFKVWYIMLLSPSWHVSLDFAKLAHLKWHASMHDSSNNISFTLGESCQWHCNYLNWGSKQRLKE